MVTKCDSACKIRLLMTFLIDTYGPETTRKFENVLFRNSKFFIKKNASRLYHIVTGKIMAHQSISRFKILENFSFRKFRIFQFFIFFQNRILYFWCYLTKNNYESCGLWPQIVILVQFCSKIARKWLVFNTQIAQK